MTINWTEKELEVIKELSCRLELTDEQTIRQALRTYQLYQAGHLVNNPAKTEYLRKPISLYSANT